MAVAVTSDASAFKRAANLPSATSISIWGWFFFTDVAPAGRFWGPLGYGNIDSATNQISSSSAGGTALSIFSSAGSSAALFTPSANTWYFCALTCAGTGAGQLVGYVRALTANAFTTASVTGASPTFNGAEWGRDGFTGDYIAGRIHACGMCDAVLSADELLRLSYFHEPQFSGIRSLNVFYPTIESVNTNANIDRSGNGRNATATVGALADSPSLLWRYVAPAMPMAAAATGTVALSGSSGALTAGTLAPNNSVALAGQALAASQGTTVAALSKALTGQAAASTAGTLVPSISIALSGQALATAQGTISAGGDVTLSLSGQALTLAAGTFASALSVTLTGSAATGAIGTLVPTTSKALSGSALASTQGTTVPALAVALTGNLLSLGQGAVSAPGNITLALTGITLTAAQGAFGPAFSKAISGSSMASLAGSAVASPSKGLSGSELASTVGSMGLAVSASLAGSLASLSQGTVFSASGGIVADLRVTYSAAIEPSIFESSREQSRFSTSGEPRIFTAKKVIH